jgi:hypothetical protein
LDHTLAGERLTKGFDLGMFFELARHPSVTLKHSATSAYIFAFFFFVFILFVSGGILETYHRDRKLTTGEFFAASAGFFWPLLRLVLLSVIPFVMVGLTYQELDKIADFVGDRAVADQVGISLSGFAFVVLFLLSLAVRLWFDIGQVMTVAQNERHAWNTMWKSLEISWRNLGSLFWIYLRISLVAWLTLATGLVIWVQVPSTATPVSFVLLELVLLSQLATRLWQLASATTWCQRHAEFIAVKPDDNTGTMRDDIIAPMSSTEPEPGPELPPATGQSPMQ